MLFLANGSIYLEAVKAPNIPEAYAFTPEWQASLKRALPQVKAGQVYTLKPDEIVPFARKLRKEGKI
jgi:hypothetical protein